MKVRMTCTGTRPLLMANVQMASPMNGYARQVKELTDKRVKTVQDRMQIARLEFEGSLYWSPETGPYLPSQNLWRSLMDGAKIIRAGKKIERGVVMAGFMLPLVYQGPRDVEGLWAGGEGPFVDIRPVGVGRGGRVDRCRPVFARWLAEADLVIDEQVIDLAQLTEAARLAGEMAGVGDYRQMYGRYATAIERL